MRKHLVPLIGAFAAILVCALLVPPAPGRSSHAPLPHAVIAPATAAQPASLSASESCCSSHDAPASEMARLPETVVLEDWAQSYLNAPPTERPALESKGIALAEKRAVLMARLIKTDPKQALENVIPLAVREALPTKVVAHLEQRVSGRGAFKVLVTTPDAVGGKSHVQRTVRIGEKEYKAFVYGRRMAQTSKLNIPMHGIAIGENLALHESPVRLLEPGEPIPLNATIANPDLKCPVSGKLASSRIAADAGGTIYYLCAGGHIFQLESNLAAAEGGSNPESGSAGNIALSSWTQGSKTVLYITVKFAGGTNYFDQATVQTWATYNENFYRENSYGSLNMTSTVTPLLTLPQSESYYLSAGWDVASNDAHTAAANAGYNYANYNLDVVCWVGGPSVQGASGWANVGTRGCWCRNMGTIVHELGHNMGLWHANAWATNDGSVIGSGSNLEYGNCFDTMGGDYGAPFNAANRNQLDWLPLNNVTTVGSSGTYRITALEQSSLVSGTPYALKIAKTGDSSGRVYWVDFRQKYFTSNARLMNGVELLWAPWSGSNGGSQLLDATPGSSNGWQDSTFVIGKTFSDTAAGIHITPLKKNGTSPESMDVVVNVGSFSGNSAPSLTLNASATSTATGRTVNFTASASDPNGDTLAYDWDFGDGTFGTNSPSASKSWSSTGTYTVKCTASDMKGGATTKTASVSVSPAPVAQSQSVGVFKNTSKAITLVATDASALTYTIIASPSHGTLSGSPPNVTYTPASNYVGPDSFVFKANNGTWDSDPGVVSIEVQDAATGLVAYWKLDEGSGTSALDSSGWNRTGTLTNGPSWTAGKIGGAVRFDTAGYIVANGVGVNTAAGANNTVAFWMKWDGTDNRLPFCWDFQTNSNYYGLWLKDGSFGFNDGNANLQGVSSSGMAGQWVHVAAVFPNGAASGSNAKLYINGSAQSVTTRMGSPALSSHSASPGVFVGGGYINFIGGSMDDVRIYNRELSAGEVSALAGSTSTQPPSIISQPADRTVSVGQTASFSVTAGGTAPFSYQWQKNGANISGATSSLYTTPATTLGDNGSTFRVIVTNSAGSATSNSATLTVTSAPNQPPTMTSAATASPNPAIAGQSVTFTAAASDPDGDALSYSWTFGDSTSGSGSSTTHAYAAAGSYTATVTVSDGKGGTVSSSVAVTVNNVSGNAVATFVTTDTATQGNWKNTYGTDGYVLCAFQQSLPSYASVTPASKSDYIWANPASDTRALQKPGTATDRIASCWYGGTFTIDVNMTDGQTHRVALYCLDYDSPDQRSERIEVLDGASGAVLDTRDMNSFSNGKYLVWDIKGFVRLRVNYIGGGNSVVSGLFFGANSTPPVAPSITTHPASQTVTAGQTATFSVAATGTAPLTYQWQKNGANISGATGSSYTTPATTTADSGSTYRVIVSNSAGSATSNSASLTVNSSGGGLVGYWKLDEGSGTIAVDSSGFGHNGTLVNAPIWTTGKIGGGLQMDNLSGYSYATASGVGVDTAAGGVNTVAFWMKWDGADNRQPFAWDWTANNNYYGLYFKDGSFGFNDGNANIQGISSAGLANQWVHVAAVFPNGSVTGANAKLYINGAAQTVTQRLGYPQLASRSATPKVVMGSGYVQFTGSVLDEVRIYSRELTASEVAALAGSTTAAPSITTHPASQSVTAGQTATFSVAATGTAPLTYQWQKNGANISGATSSSYTTPATTTADNGSTFRVIVSNSVGSATSNSATLTVGSSGGGLVGYWNLNEGSGTTAADTSGFGHNGTLTSGPVWTAGRIGSGLQFNGVYETMVASGVAVNTAAGASNTVAFWMKWDGTDHCGPFAWDSANSNYYSLWLKDGSFGFNDGNSNIQGISSAGLAGQWVHVAAVFPNGSVTGANAKLYINGAAQAVTQRMGYPQLASRSATPRIFVGSDFLKFSGILDEVRIYNRELSASEVSALATAAAALGADSTTAATEDHVIDLGTVTVNTKVRLTIPLPQALANEKRVVWKTDAGLPRGLRCSKAKLSGKTAVTGDARFSVTFKTKSATGVVITSQQYRLTVAP